MKFEVNEGNITKVVAFVVSLYYLGIIAGGVIAASLIR
jgi:hypothetical protein